MSEKPLLTYSDNKGEARSSIKHGRDALVIPILREKEVYLYYHRGKLTDEYRGVDSQQIKQNRVPSNIYEQMTTWGGFNIKDLAVRGFMLKSGLFIAQSVESPKGEYHSFMQNLSLLHGRGFQTILPFSGWMDFTSCKRSRHIERQIEQRLAIINAVVRSERASLWDDGRGRDRYKTLHAVKNVLILDCIGFKPTVNDPHVRSVYKAGS